MRFCALKLEDNIPAQYIEQKSQRKQTMTDGGQKSKAIGDIRWMAERTFGSLKCWFGSGVIRLKGKNKVHPIHVLEAIAHNLKRPLGSVAAIAG